MDVLVDDGLFEPEWCRELTYQAASARYELARVGARASTASVSSAVRRSAVSCLPERARIQFVSRLLLAARRFERHFGVIVSGVEEPALLRYRPGDHFAPHRDRCIEPGADEWARERELTVVVGLCARGSFGGGELLLHRSDGARTSIEVTEGRTIVFRAEQLHEVAVVTRGERRVVAAWLVGARRA